MQAGAAMAVVGWWTGYKIGGVVAAQQNSFKIFLKNYWQVTFLVLGVVIIACNIGLMFVDEALQINRSEFQNGTDKMIEDKLGALTFNKNCCLANRYSCRSNHAFFKKIFNIV